MQEISHKLGVSHVLQYQLLGKEISNLKFPNCQIVLYYEQSLGKIIRRVARRHVR